MKIVKTSVLLLAPFAWASKEAAHEHLRRELSIPHRELDTCGGGEEPPDDTKSQIVELSYYEQWTSINVTLTDGIPDKIFKFIGCGRHTVIGISSCFSQPNNTAMNPVFTLWTRGALEYNLERCVDGKKSSPGRCSYPPAFEYMIELIAYRDEEYYFKPGLHGNTTNSPTTYPDGTYYFGYAILYTDSPWPCFPSVTDTYVHGSTEVDFSAGVDDNIKADFFYTGEFENRTFEVVLFADQTCTAGNAIAATTGASFGNISSVLPSSLPFDISILEHGAYPTEYQKVILEANQPNWLNGTGYWNESFGTDPATGLLTLCVQFQVMKGDYLVEFVDVAYEIAIDLVQECSCGDLGASGSGRARRLCKCPCPPEEPACGNVTIIRDEVTGEELEDDPDIPMMCGPCEGNTTVTQGESFPVCMTLFNDTDDYCIAEATELVLTVDYGTYIGIYKILPLSDLHDAVLAGPLECDEDGECVVRITPPAKMITDLTAGTVAYPEAGYTGSFSGNALIGFGSCPAATVRRELEGAAFTSFVGREFNVKMDPPPATCPKPDGLRGRFRWRMCLLRERLRNLFNRD